MRFGSRNEHSKHQKEHEPSASDAAHAARRWHEVSSADFVACFFVPDDFPEIVLKVGIRGVAAQTGAEVMLFDAEQACTYLAVGGEP